MQSASHWTMDQAGDQTGRLAVITGANVGLGFATARALASKGSSLVLACRDAHKATQAKAELLKEFPRAAIECENLDTSSLASVRAFAARFLAQHDRCDLLINNAGIMMTPYQKTADGFEGQLAANYLGHFLLTSLLLPTITQTPGARVVNLSSLAHNWSPIQFDDIHFEQRYNRKLAYGQSKTACLMFALELQRRLSAAGKDTLSMAAHPGFSNTQLGRNLPFPLNKLASLFAPLISQSAAEGALPSLYAALGDDLKGGAYTGPSGRGEIKGPPRVVGCNDWAKDPAAAARLWDLSERMTGATWSWVHAGEAGPGMPTRSSPATSRQVETTINYVARRDEPIYSYEFMEPPAGKAATNRFAEPHRVAITNMRDLAQAPSLDREGFMIAPFTTQVSDIYDLVQVDAVYIPEMASFLKQLLGAREVLVYMPFLRGPEAQRRAPGSITAPAGFAHVDYMEETGPRYFEELLGPNADLYRGRDFAFINAWRPITGPLRDHPLAVCDARSVAPEDMVTSVSIARVSADGLHSDQGELHEYPIYTPASNPDHRWYYAADLMPNEVLLFKNYDSRKSVARYVPHTAFADPNMPADALPRASIEVRSLVIW